jgi:RNA polymerase sigma-70 factor (ECF subfamily)
MTFSRSQIRDSEADLVRRAAANEHAAVRRIIQTYNQRLYRIARSVVRDDSEAEDVLQEAYLRAFAALSAFRGESTLATWLSRIVLNEALQRRRKRVDTPEAGVGVDMMQPRGADIIPFPLTNSDSTDPERAMAQNEICQLLERAIDELPEDFRVVLVLRTLEDMSVEETASLLGLREETVKTRLHRARRLLREALAEHIGPLFSDVFPFQGHRCERIADAVVQRLSQST